MPARAAKPASCSPRLGSRSSRPATISTRPNGCDPLAGAGGGRRVADHVGAVAAAAGGVLGQGFGQHQRLAQREVEVDRSGAAAQRGPVGAAGQRSDPAQALDRRVVNADLDEPFRRAAVELDLIDRLPGPDVAELGRAVRGEDDQRHPRLVGLDHRRGQVGGRGARGTRDGHRAPRRLGGAEGEEPRRSARRCARSSRCGRCAPARARSASNASRATCTRGAGRSAPVRRRRRGAACRCRWWS